MKNRNCQNCGADRGLHHYQTMQCPVGGQEALIGRKQEWMTLTYQPEDDSAETIAALTAKIARLEKIVQSMAELSPYSSVEINYLINQAQAELKVQS